MDQQHSKSWLKSRPIGLRAARQVFAAVVSPEDTTDPTLPHVEGYTFVKKLGSGAGGVVYLAHRTGSDRDLAVKVLNRSAAAGATARRAWRELDVLSQLDLSCTPCVHDYGVSHGQMYIAADYVDGMPLTQYCEQHDLGLTERVELLATVADAVQTIHERGVIHRDLKPDNILITPQRQPMILDLGVASSFGHDLSATLTADGVPVGTPAFMSPEQARGDRAELSTRSDVYGLGATACYLLTGKTPHDMDAALHEAIRRVAQDPPRNPQALDPALPKPLAHIVSKALAFVPSERHVTAAEFAADLRRWTRGEPIAWTRPSALSRLRYWVSQNRALSLALAAAVLSLIAAVALGSVAMTNAALARERQELADARAAHLEEMTVWREEVNAREARLQERRQRQISRIRQALDQGALFDATLVLLNLAEEIEAEDLNNQEALTLFTTRLNDLCEAARAEAQRTNAAGEE